MTTDGVWVPRLKRLYRYLALLITLGMAGVGHAMIGRWKRGLAWLGLYVLSLTLLSGYALTTAEATGPFIASALSASLSPADIAFPLSILVLCLVDLYLITAIRSRRDVHHNGTGQ